MPATLIAVLALLPSPVQDLHAVRLEGSARKDVEGWVQLKLAGEPANVGYQYGFLAAKEIDDAIRTVRHQVERRDGIPWTTLRQAADRLFRAKLTPEISAELQGLSDGLAKGGFKHDFGDVLAFNAHIELVGYYFPWVREQNPTLAALYQLRPPLKVAGWHPGPPMACSAFVATKGMTADGKVVMGHNLWWDYMVGSRFNVVLDVRPAKGRAFMQEGLMGMIHSGSDWSVNDAGICITETTISGFHGFDPEGDPEFQRARLAVQYSETLDDVVRILRVRNNGGYANTWLLADTKSGEIGKLELGLKNVIFHRTTQGAYVGANFPEDPKLMREEVRGYDPKTDTCEHRRQRWEQLLTATKGRVDAEAAKRFLGDTIDARNGRNQPSMSTICGVGHLGPGGGFAWGATNAKVVTSEMAKGMRFWARTGFPNGISFRASEYLQRQPSDGWMRGLLRDMPARDWVVLERL